MDKRLEEASLEPDMEMGAAIIDAVEDYYGSRPKADEEVEAGHFFRLGVAWERHRQPDDDMGAAMDFANAIVYGMPMECVSDVRAKAKAFLVMHPPDSGAKSQEEGHENATPRPWRYKTTPGSDHKLCTIYGADGRAVARHVKPEDARKIVRLSHED